MAYKHKVRDQQPLPDIIAGWEDDEPVAGALGACFSPEEAFAAVSDQLEPVKGRDKWWRHRWRKTLSTPGERFHEVAQRHDTTGHRLCQYLYVLSAKSDRDGVAPVYSKRVNLAEEMRCSVATVARCRSAAIELGYHTAGIQLRWINEDKPGEDPWCGGPSMVRLIMPDKASLEISDRAVKAAQRIENRRRAQYRAAQERKAAAEEKHRRQMDALVTSAPSPPSVKPKLRTAGVQEALASARAALDSS